MCPEGFSNPSLVALCLIYFPLVSIVDTLKKKTESGLQLKHSFMSTTMDVMSYNFTS